jgi:hypothetical protein
LCDAWERVKEEKNENEEKGEKEKGAEKEKENEEKGEKDKEAEEEKEKDKEKENEEKIEKGKEAEKEKEKEKKNENEEKREKGKGAEKEKDEKEKEKKRPSVRLKNRGMPRPENTFQRETLLAYKAMASNHVQDSGENLNAIVVPPPGLTTDRAASSWKEAWISEDNRIITVTELQHDRMCFLARQNLGPMSCGMVEKFVNFKCGS